MAEKRKSVKTRHLYETDNHLLTALSLNDTQVKG